MVLHNTIYQKLIIMLSLVFQDKPIIKFTIIEHGKKGPRWSLLLKIWFENLMRLPF